MIKISNKFYIKEEDVNDGNKLVLVYDKNGNLALRKNCYRFYDTKHKKLIN